MGEVKMWSMFETRMIHVWDKGWQLQICRGEVFYNEPVCMFWLARIISYFYHICCENVIFETRIFTADGTSAYIYNQTFCMFESNEIRFFVSADLMSWTNFDETKTQNFRFLTNSEQIQISLSSQPSETGEPRKTTERREHEKEFQLFTNISGEYF